MRFCKQGIGHPLHLRMDGYAVLRSAMQSLLIETPLFCTFEPFMFLLTVDWIPRREQAVQWLMSFISARHSHEVSIGALLCCINMTSDALIKICILTALIDVLVPDLSSRYYYLISCSTVMLCLRFYKCRRTVKALMDWIRIIPGKALFQLLMSDLSSAGIWSSCICALCKTWTSLPCSLKICGRRSR